ncbi:MAG: hypothetical protein JWP97_3472 [Labilithrix sp.]|nr:hypothetical protein [Labilithrix sp.]
MKRGAGLLAVLLPLLLTGTARADETADARAEYDAGAAAYDRRDYATAARRFALADEHAPNPRVLQLALVAAWLAPEPALGMNLVERDERRNGGSDPAHADLARKLRARYERILGRVKPTCPAPCEASVDGVRAEPGQDLWVTAGVHEVRLVVGDRPPVVQRADVAAGARVTVAPPVLEEEAPRPAPASTASLTGETAGPHATSAVPFWIGVAATTAAVTVAGILTAVVIDRHDDFVTRPSAATARAGDAAQDRARGAWVVSGVLAAGTLAIGVGTYW